MKIGHEIDAADPLLTDREIVEAGGSRYMVVVERDASSKLLQEEGAIWRVVGSSVAAHDFQSLFDDIRSGRSEALARRHADFLDRVEQEADRTVGPLFREAGLSPQHQGGGCMGWMRFETDEDHDRYILVTNDAMSLVSEPSDPVWIAGRYDGEDYVAVVDLTIAEALEAIDLLPSPGGGSGLTFANLAELRASTRKDDPDRTMAP